MRRLIAMLLAAALAISLSVSVAEQKILPELGVKYEKPDDFADHNLELDVFPAQAEDAADVLGVVILYNDVEVMGPLFDTLVLEMAGDPSSDSYKAAAAAYMEACDKYLLQIGAFVGFRTEKQDELMAKYGFDKDTILLGVNGDYTYYLQWEDPESLRCEENTAKLDDCYACARSITDTIELIEVAAAEEADTAAPQIAGMTFETTDMNGNAVDQSILAKADLTILNVWATDCPACIAEMPELELWSRELPENVQIIGLITDVRSDSDKTYARAEKILGKVGVTYPCLMMCDGFNDLLSSIAGTPTTFFLDSNGNSVNEPVVGAYVDQYRQAVEAFLNK